MREQILQLEKISRQLDPDPTQREEIRKLVVDYAENFLNSIETKSAFNETKGNDVGLLSFPVSEEPLDPIKVISLIKNHVDEPGLNPASGGHLGYIPGGGIYSAHWATTSPMSSTGMQESIL